MDMMDGAERSLHLRLGGQGRRVSRWGAGGWRLRLFEDWLRPAIDSGTLVPVLEPWWQSSRDRFSTTATAGICRHRSAPSSISLKACGENHTLDTHRSPPCIDRKSAI